MTRPNAFAPPISISLLVEDVHALTEQFQVAEDGPHVTEQLLALLKDVEVGGKQIHDANIVSTMLVHGIDRLLTHNVDDFKRFAHLIQIIPLEVR